MVSQTSIPQSGSDSQAPVTIRAACSGVGGWGSGFFGGGGGDASFTGLTETHRQRTPFSYAACSTKWMCRIVVPDSGLHA
jgi:hypothetical protein